jgi:chromate transporter
MSGEKTTVKSIFYRLKKRPNFRTLADIAAVFLKIGLTAFGGPAAHVAMMREEIVERRQWIDDQHFLDLLGATNLIPGPNSSEMSMHIGYVRGGFLGLIVGGLGFLLPSMVMALGAAWAYVRYGSTPAAGWLLEGIKPVIIPLIVLAIWSLGRKAVKSRITAIVGLVALILYFVGVNFVALLVGGGLIVMLLRNRDKALPLLSLLKVGTPAAATSFSLGGLAWVFFKIGLLMYGSGYVLFAFLHADLVERRGWITEQQLIDAIAVGQMTPGPLSTSATFIGYILDGVPGALIATFALYLPAFVFVGLSNPLIPRVRRSPWAGSFLDGVNAAALGLMAAVTWELARAAYIDLFTILIGLVAAVLLFRYKLNSVWLVLFGAFMGLMRCLGL